MACLDDLDVDDLAEGRLSGERLASVVEHLAHCTSCSDVVAVIAGARSADPCSRWDEPGARVGRYTVLERIGSGAMGIVLSAHDADLDRRVALKILRTDGPHSSEAATERMLREAQAMARLAHPNVVTVHEVGLHEGSVFIAMELVSGKTLRAYTTDPGRTTTDIVEAFRAAAEGLAAAHAAGIVHRDFKPENVLVGDDGRVRVTDFGLARAASAPVDGESDHAPTGDDAHDTNATLTKTGTILGTPAYMAPEVFDGGTATAASDQYSFGAALFEALHGTRPFQGKNIRELRAAIAARAMTVPTRNVPRWLDHVVTRTLALDPRERYPEMRAVASAMGAGRKPDRRFALALGGATLALSTAVLIAVFARPPQAPAKQPDADVCAEAGASISSTWNDDHKTTLRRAFEQVGDGKIADAAIARLDAYAAEVSRARIANCKAKDLVDAKTACLDRRTSELGATVGGLEHADAAALASALDTIAALAAPAECSDASALVAMPPRPRDAATLAKLEALEVELTTARTLSAEGKGDDAAKRAVDIAKRATDLGYRPFASDASLFAASSLRRLGALPAAAEQAEAAISHAEASHADMLAARAWLERTSIAGEASQWGDAERDLGFASAAIERVGSPDHLEASLLQLRGLVAMNEQRYDDANAAFERALALRERLQAVPDADVARTLTARGNLARARGKLDEALDMHRKARAVDEGLLGTDHPALARHFHNEAGVLRLMGKRAEARAAYEHAIALETKGFGPRHASVGRTHNSLGLLLLDGGDLAGAKTELELAVSILQEARSVDLRAASYNLGLALAGLGERETAIARFRTAIDDSNGIPDPAIRIRARVALADDLHALGGVEREKAAAEELEHATVEAGAVRDPALMRAMLDAVADERTRVQSTRPAPSTAPPPHVQPHKAAPPSGAYAPAQTWD